MIWDLETENHHSHKRFANPFDARNYIVASGWKHQGQAAAQCNYFTSADAAHPTYIPATTKLLVGHNIKFDLLYEWGRNNSLKEFIRRGGEIWDTQYAEYLLNGQHPDSQMCSMDSIAEKYGGRLKIDAVKELWKQGWLTSAIDKDMLIDYLIGTEEEHRNSGDIGNTEKILLGQVALAKKRNMLPMIRARMDGLLCTTEMEYNGLFIDVIEAKRRTHVLEKRLEELDVELNTFIPKLPDGLVFNWSSGNHVSALLFGGALKYSVKSSYLDKDGNIARKNETQTWRMFGGVAMPESWWLNNPEAIPDTFTSGKKKGDVKFKTVIVPGAIKERMTEFIFDIKGCTTAKTKWATKSTDARGNPVYMTGADIIEELGTRDIKFLKLMAERQNIVKDLGTYYIRYDETSKDFKGMLTCVHKDTKLVHHSLNHTATITGRLSSSDPNLQNIPRADTSEVKKMFISRFENGVMLEADYSQLEIIGQAVLTKDNNMIADILNQVDFHCKRVAKKFGITYEEAVDWCKNPNNPNYKTGKDARTKAKTFSFQRAFGAGAAKIAESTGMTEEDVKELIAAEEVMYPNVSKFHASVTQAVENSARPFRDAIRGNKMYRRGWYQLPTGTIFTFRSYDSFAFQQKKGIMDTFSPTEIKNYPTQGICGEIVQIILGKLFRHFVATKNYNGKAVLCNQVHDSVWIDVHSDIVQEVGRDVKRIMESVPQVLKELYGMDIPVPFPVEVETGKNLYSKSALHLI